MTVHKKSFHGKGKCRAALFLGMLFFLTSFPITLRAQEENPYLTYKVPFQNLLKFNRFLINPTFSTVRENKSYVNFFHRSQSAYFENNVHNYFLSYSGRINDRTGLGLSLYNQQEGVVSNFGVVANYAYGIRLGKNSVFSFGVNVPYYRSNLDRNSVVAGEEDPLLAQLGTSSILLVQPGINLAMGHFDMGLFAENLADFNFQSGETLTAEKIFSGHLQYTQNFQNRDGIFEDGRFLPLARVRFMDGGDMEYGGGIILDLPKMGWLQGGYDSFYGASAGAGFNVGKRFSLGYNVEKGLSDTYDNFGVTHEISVALSFIPRLTEKMVHRDTKKSNRRKKGLKDIPGQNKSRYALAAFPESPLTDLVLDSLQMARQSLPMPKLSLKEQNAVAQNTPEYNKHRDFKDPKEILTRKFGKIPGIEQGNYIIANVFGDRDNVEKFMGALKNNGLEASYFENPENGLFYVYLGYFKEGFEARKAYLSNLDGKYQREIWIMNIDDSRYKGMANLQFTEDE